MKKYKNFIFIFLIVLLALRVFIPQLDGLKESIVALKEANMYWIIAGIIIYFTGVPILAIQSVSLAIKALAYALTFRVEMATLFVNKILPNGVGTISLNMFYFVKKGHTSSEAASVITMNSISSTVAYFFLVILALTQSSLSLEGLSGSIDIPTNLIFFLLILLLGASYTLYRSANLRGKIKTFWIELKKDIASYKQRPRAVTIALVCNGLGTSANVFALYASAHAIGIQLSLAEALLAYTFGNIAAALVPTPGGIGSAEAGIYSGLVLTGVDGPSALTITLLYRFISYWLPIAPGYYFFWGLRKSLLVDYSMKNGNKQKQIN